MANYLYVVKSAYDRAVEDLRELAKQKDISGIIHFLDFVNGKPTPELIQLDLGIPSNERQIFRGIVDSYASSYHLGTDNGVLHLSQLIKELFAESIGRVKQSTKTFIGIAETVEETDRKFDLFLTENNLQGTDLKDRYRQLRYKIADVVYLFKESATEEIDPNELKAKIGETAADLRGFGQDKRIRNFRDYRKLKSGFAELVKHLNSYSSEISSNYEKLSENLDEKFGDFEERLADVESNLGDEYDISPQTKIISKEDVLKFATAFDFVFRRAEENKRRPKLVIMPCTTYRRKTNGLLYFDRNGCLRKKRVSSKERQNLDREIEIETDTKTSGETLFFSITADVNRYVITETLPDERIVERSRAYSWPRISCVLMSLGEFIYSNVLISQTFDPRGLYQNGEFVGPYKKPFGLSRALIIYKNFLDQHGRQDEAISKFGDVEMGKWNEATWREMMGMVAACVVYSKVAREFIITIDGFRNPRNFYNSVYPAFRGALGME